MNARPKERFWTAPALLVLSVALAARFTLWAMGGTQISPDGQAYLSMCGPFWHQPSGWLTGSLKIEYAGFQAPLCTFLALPGTTVDHWILVQILAGAMTSVLVFGTAARWYGVLAGMFAGLGFAVLWETARWDTYVLSETTFILALALFLWLLSERHAENGRHIPGLVLVASAVWLAFTRPIGLPILAAFLVWDLLPRGSRWRIGLVRHPVLVLVLWAAAAFLVLGLSDRTEWADSALHGFWADGVLVHDDPALQWSYEAREADSLAGFALRNAAALAWMGVLKAGLFFWPFAGRFSPLHNAMNLVTLVPVIALGFAGAVLLARDRRPELRLWVTPLLVMVLMAAITFIDFDWRYRAPATLVLCVLAARCLATGSPLYDAIKRVLRPLASFANRFQAS